MATPPLASRLPSCALLEERLRAGDDAEADIAHALRSASAELAQGLAAFRGRSDTSALPLQTHAFKLEGRADPVRIGTKTAALVATLAPQLVRLWMRHAPPAACVPHRAITLRIARARVLSPRGCAVRAWCRGGEPACGAVR
jgi:hypothetical protein